ncbi:MAG: RdgB/HAM1 family non-canonical purine NTP pyrophosphatase [Rhodospirillales bacterium]
MVRRFSGGKLVVASHNEHKVGEIGVFLEPFGVETVSAGSLGLPEPEETGDSFVANAHLKAVAAAGAANLPALADDSGLCVSALGGEPGIYSARWGGPEKDFDLAMRRVHEGIGANPDRSACFVAVLCLAWPDGHTDCFEGRVDGTIIWPPRGDAGFGYDPIFQPAGESRSFAEMSGAEKHAVSHRARAFDQLVAACFG